MSGRQFTFIFCFFFCTLGGLLFADSAFVQVTNIQLWTFNYRPEFILRIIQTFLLLYYKWVIGIFYRYVAFEHINFFL